MSDELNNTAPEEDTPTPVAPVEPTPVVEPTETPINTEGGDPVTTQETPQEEVPKEESIESGTPEEDPKPQQPHNHTTPNMHFNNKYAIEDKVWVVFSIESDIKVGLYTVKSLNCEVIGLDAPHYMYGFSIAGDGQEDAANLMFVIESKIFFDKAKAIEHASTLIDELHDKYNKSMDEERKKYEDIIVYLNQQKAKINVNNLEVKEPVAKHVPQPPAPTAEEQVARNMPGNPQTPTSTPETPTDQLTDQPNPESNEGEDRV